MRATAVLLLGYLWLLGFPAPAVRSGALLLLADVARLRQRVVAPRGVVALAALGMLLQDGWALQSVGAWLSVAGVGAVIWADRAFARAPRVARLAAPALAATLVTAPISALAFGTVAPIGVLANLIAIPLAGVAVPGLVMALGLSWLGSGLAHLIAAGAGLGLALLDLVARGAALVPGGHVVMVAGWQAALIWTAVAAVAWWLWNSPRRPWLIAGRVALVTTVFIATSFRDVVSLDACRCLTVHFLDVGQGDAAALRTPNGRWIVIDGGPRTPAGDAGRRVVVPFLRSHGVGRVAVVVATHGDADHLGGLPAVVEAFDPELVLEPGEPLGRAVARGARGRPDRGGRGGARGAEPRFALAAAAARCERPRRGAAGAVRRHAAAVSSRRGAAGRGPFGGDRGQGGPIEGRASRLAHGHLGRVARRAGAARGGDQRGSEQQLRPSGAGRAPAPRAPRHHGVPDRSERHHHFLHGWAG